MSKKGENIYKRKDGRWEGRYKCGCDKNGKSRYKSVYAKTYKECRDKLNHSRAAEEKEKNGIRIFMTVEKLLRLWLGSIAANVKKSTVGTYENIISNHITPIMGNMAVTAVTTDFLNSFVNEKIKCGRLDGGGGLSPKTVQNIIGVIKSAFKYAERIYGIKNPAAYVAVQKADKNDIEVLSIAEAEIIKKYCKANDGCFSLIYDLCISTGIRIGELCALQCGDIDFENGIIKISRTVQRVKNDDICSPSKTKVIITPPKTKSSARKIPLPEKLAERLRDFTRLKSDGDFVFSSDCGKPLDVRTVQKRFASILKKCGLRKVKFHILRHTFATKWADSGFDIKGLSEILGHSSVKVTLSLYVHPSVEEKRRQINALYSA